MDVDTFIVAVFCTVEDWLEGEQPLRQRRKAIDQRLYRQGDAHDGGLRGLRYRRTQA